MASKSTDETESSKKASGFGEVSTEDAMLGRSFEILFHGYNSRPCSAPPKRFRNYQKKGITRQEMDKKQQEAKTRRKENEKEMIKRIVQKREECQRLNANFEVLLAQDAKLQGAAETPKLSKKELMQKFHSVRRDYCKIATSINTTVSHQAVDTSKQ